MKNDKEALFISKITEELERARVKFADLSSLHEGYAVILEELDELWEVIKKKPYKGRRDDFFSELIQVGAMAMRLYIDVHEHSFDE